VQTFNSILISYSSLCIGLLLFIVWPLFLLRLAYRKFVVPWRHARQLAAAQARATPELDDAPASSPEPELSFPGSERLAMARARRRSGQ
jgi:hypothetical protein